MGLGARELGRGGGKMTGHKHNQQPSFYVSSFYTARRPETRALFRVFMGGAIQVRVFCFGGRPVAPASNTFHSIPHHSVNFNISSSHNLAPSLLWSPHLIEEFY